MNSAKKNRSNRSFDVLTCVCVWLFSFFVLLLSLLQVSVKPKQAVCTEESRKHFDISFQFFFALEDTKDTHAPRRKGSLLFVLCAGE